MLRGDSQNETRRDGVGESVRRDGQYETGETGQTRRGRQDETGEALPMRRGRQDEAHARQTWHDGQIRETRRHGCERRVKQKRESLMRTRQHLTTNNVINEVQRLRSESSPGEHPPLMHSNPNSKRAPTFPASQTKPKSQTPPCFPTLLNATRI